MLENKQTSRDMPLISTGPVTEEEEKGWQFPKRKRNAKKQDQHTDKESKRDEKPV